VIFQRDRENRVFAGVTGGIARFLGINVKPVRVLLRIAFVFPPILMMTFWAYVFLWAVMPLEPAASVTMSARRRPQPTKPKSKPRFMRDRRHRVLAGVTGGIARMLRINVPAVRMVLRVIMLLPPFVVVTFWVYVFLWAVSPLEPPVAEVTTEPADPRAAPEEVSESAAVDPVMDALEQLTNTVRFKYLQRQISQNVYDKIMRIHSLFEEVLPQISRDNIALDYDAYTLRQTAVAYFPETVNTYLSLPVRQAREYRLSDGKTAEENLLEQLTLIEDIMEDVADSLYENDAQRVQIQGRFLADRLERDKVLR
jgi:phage shock protein PspC (stress-responsive transcriptional regulator)